MVLAYTPHDPWTAWNLLDTFPAFELDLSLVISSHACSFKILLMRLMCMVRIIYFLQLTVSIIFEAANHLGILDLESCY